MPLKHQSTKLHKKIIINIIVFCDIWSFCDFVAEKDLSECTQIWNLEFLFLAERA